MGLYQFSKRSLDNLQGVHPKLKQICMAALGTDMIDFSVIDGVRTLDEQRRLVAKGVSKTMNSKHLKQADGYGHAVDLCPYPFDWSNITNADWARFGFLAGIIRREAQGIGEIVTWGCDWDRDGQTRDHSFLDAPHFQLEVRI